MKRQSPMSAIEPMIRREREMYHELKHQNAELLEVLKDIVSWAEYFSGVTGAVGVGGGILDMKPSIEKAKQAIAKAEGKE